MIGRASCLLGSLPIALPLPPTAGRLIPARSRLRFFRQWSSFSTRWAPGLVGLGSPSSEHRQKPHLATLRSRMAHSHPSTRDSATGTYRVWDTLYGTMHFACMLLLPRMRETPRHDLSSWPYTCAPFVAQPVSFCVGGATTYADVPAIQVCRFQMTKADTE